MMEQIADHSELKRLKAKNKKLQEQLDSIKKVVKQQDSRIKKYEYVFDFLGLGFKEWATKILDGEAEVICETDEQKKETVIRFRFI